jgi:molecular chaperone DnaK (HSP70)
MIDLVFRDFSDATRNAIPSVVGLCSDNASFCIGNDAKESASRGMPVVQDFKRKIGDTDAMFVGSRPEALWPIRPGTSGRQAFLSTEEATKIFFNKIVEQTGPLPKQLVVGIPASDDDQWQRYYKTHLTKVLSELGFVDPKFFPEPFAVFQYYRHCEKVIPNVDHAQTIIVVDIGGGTFDCCAIQTTVLGNLARKGTTAAPLGIRSKPFAGKDIDRWLFDRALEKISNPLLKKDSPSARLQAHPLALFVIEEMKISLSDKIQQQNLSLADDCDAIEVHRDIPRGAYHPDVPLTLRLTGEDLKAIVLKVWKEHWGPTLLHTLGDIKFRGGKVAIDTIDKVILAGGSSHLAFIQQLVAKTLAGQIGFNPHDIVVGAHFAKAVAYGLAVEAKEQRNTSLRTHNSIGPCIFNPLYFYVANDRTTGFIAPQVKLKKAAASQPNGVLLEGPMELGGLTAEFEIILPFKPKKYFIYRFFDTPCLSDQLEVTPLNVENDVVRVPHNCPLQISLKLHFGEDGVVKPEFTFGREVVPARNFFFGGLQIAREVDSYAGIDFGTSNSYVVNLWSEAVSRDEVSRDIAYPTFSISESTGNQLRLLEVKIKEYQAAELLNADSVRRLAEKQRTGFIFNSIKIEGSSLSRGETERALFGEIPIVSKELKEPVNVAKGYDFVWQNASAYRASPEIFLRELNKMILDGISEDAGKYRVDSVKLAGMDFEPPPAFAIQPYMEMLAAELRGGPGTKSAIHFAAEAHAKFTAIHPFEDGNGRTARLLANAILIDAGLCPITVEFGDKERYLDCLKASNAKDLSLMCGLFTELMEEVLDELKPNVKSGTSGVLPAVQAVATVNASQRLADAVRRKVAALHVEKEARYGAWSASFNSFREELAAAAGSFNETFQMSHFSIKVNRFDMLPLEKYEGIILGARTPKTWLVGCQIRGLGKQENFVFFFQTISAAFTASARGRKIAMPTQEVSLAISKWTDGVFRRLLDEPVALREIAYLDGQFFYLAASPQGKLEVKSAPTSEMIQEFFADVVEAFF